MYRPYNYRSNSRYSFFFGYHYRPSRYYGLDNYNFFDPYYDYSYNSFFYDDYYYPSYPSYYHSTNSNYYQYRTGSGSGTPQNSNAVRKFNRLRHTGSSSALNGSNPAPYYIPLIKSVKSNENEGSKRATVRKSKSRGTSEVKSRSSSRKSKEVKSSGKKTTTVKSSSHRGRSGKSRSITKSDSGEKSSSTKKSSKRK